MSEILVPDINGNSYFASPSMIYHYVVTHRYLPPKSFIEAVMNVDLSMKFLAEDIFDNLLGART
ncbi:hypothetical protein [Hahella ganghwensis]|uniref:DUF7919 family protein n=1 Tax=Hahella ganghwensis TaxID=286420 RepID=UPI00039B496B|nr:hypothetical protein [Hahella ganghwensis]